MPRPLLLLLSLVLVLLSGPVWAQRPLLNHTFNSLPMSQHQSNNYNNYNYQGPGKQLRNGRLHEQPQPLPLPTLPGLAQPVHVYDDYEGEASAGTFGSRPPPGSRRDTRRRLNLSHVGAGGAPRPERGNGQRGIESLRKELMKPSVGGPGGGISGSSAGYASYSATSSIGKIDGLGGIGSADRYGERLRQPTGAAAMTAGPATGPYSTRFPPLYAGLDSQPIRTYPRKNSISELLKLKKSFNQADEPAGGVTHGNMEGDTDADVDQIDPIQQIKERIRDTAPKPNTYSPHTESTPSTEIEDLLGVKCNFETPCAWIWTENLSDGFQVLSGTELAKKNMTGLLPGPVADSIDDANGHFLYARVQPTTKQLNLTSPSFSTTLEKCYLEVYMHQSDMSHGLSRVVVEPLHPQESSWVPAEIQGDNFRSWTHKIFRLGRISRDFRIVFEIVPELKQGQKAHVALDNLRMVNCFPEGTKSEKCSTSQVKCMMNKVPVCIPLPRICDITRDCDDAEDELQSCDKIPYGGRCDFEDDWCGWRDSGRTTLIWSRHTGSSPTHDTGPDGDHTQQHLLNTTGGYYMLVNMNQHINNTEKSSIIGFASNAIMLSKNFNPPPSVHGNPDSPYRNSCVVRFYIHQFGKNPGSINLSVVEMKEKENITTTLWWSTKNQGSDWLRAEYVLPNITSKYYLQFEARMGMRIFSDVAVDDFSLSPECFGLNIPEEHLNGYNYWDVRQNLKSPTHHDFDHTNYLELTTCDTRGMIGPTQTQCESAYKEQNQSHVLREVHVVEDQSTYKGMQKWKVPNEGHYTIIAKGASGGLGSGGVGSSRGSVAVAVLELLKNEELYFLVGQQGENACIKSMGVHKEAGCGTEHDLDLGQYSFRSKQDMVKNIYIENGAGGGGGGSFVFLLNQAKNEAVPLLVAGGGGGLGIGQYIDEDFQHGQKAKPLQAPESGQIHGEQLNKKTAGPGGGWRAKEDQALSPTYGAALLQGGRGGHSCYVELADNGTTVHRHGQGGFGGGGGGCNTGGGGGGYAGGDVYLNESNGEGGSSYISNSRSLRDASEIYAGASSGSGAIIIIPAIEGCGCDYRCVALDEFRSKVRCICPDGWSLKRDNNTACERQEEAGKSSFQYLVSILMISLAVLFICIAALIFMLYNRYQRKKQAKMRHKMLVEQDLQLSRLRHNADDSNLNNFNPNYGCDGILNGHIDVNSLPQVARESLQLVNALGKGAFGEVYLALYRHRDGDAVEMPVAVKTLREDPKREKEEDFLKEAAIMAKFNHPNMVHLIGVCFDRQPYYIVLELLAGGDLQKFLRENRNTPERPSLLTMKDLLFCALDVAKGCRYMESKRFIHRDIAARNCLLSSKGPGRVVKIADFGMSRDIYRSDYYRKGGKAMLPIKWMPPEAFLDGIFTSKTDVWSFGILLWEVFSLGRSPYPGQHNTQVMELVVRGGRLGSPTECPVSIYKIMADCWNPTPEDRPTFTSLLEHLTACTQDASIMNAPLPNILGPTASERDETVIRPPNGDEFCLAVPDYLVPLPGNGMPHAPGSVGGFYAPTVQRQQNTCTPPAVTSPAAPKPPAMPEQLEGAAALNGGGSDCWETSFILPNSKSDQPLLSAGAITTMTSGDSQRNLQAAAAVASMAASATATPILRSPTHSDEAKLISLDTPQPTPTTIQPPLSFASQLDGITLDPAALTKSLSNGGAHNGATGPTGGAAGALGVAANGIAKQSYANVQVQLKGEQERECSKLNGSLPAGNGAIINGETATGGAHANDSPFTIQGYAERYKDNNNHSEISC
ncbi:ALK tyrosine kinase receptor [Drosophila novamexicana]|uniref:ALK tyrosine kinase receptor n=1 Tax=Drosophila novamexicana TaxID=47314 RepID=UPI0011E5FF1E|nr:ALK tyrosine kinase receptor [Drosophila novamexicana]